MKILSAAQIRQADNYTIQNEPVTSLALMKRAGEKCFEWILSNTDKSKKYLVICGTGNNGGDGLVIARLLAQRKLGVEVVILSTNSKYSDEFNITLEAITKTTVNVKHVKEGQKLLLKEDVIIIDAILGTGLSRPVTGWLGECIEVLNKSGNQIISIDIPSGLFADIPSEGNIIRATYTLTFQNPKLAFFFRENELFVGKFYVLNIDLNEKFIDKINSLNFYFDKKEAKKILKQRNKFSHKGAFGHSLLIAGSKGKIGAAILASRACLRSGTGLLTVHIPSCGYEIIQATVPEAMVDLDVNTDIITSLNSIDHYDGIGIGPGIGKSEETTKFFFRFLDIIKSPVVVDADAINILAEHPEKLRKLPVNSILTPHGKEFERLAGKCKNDFERHKLQLDFSREYKLIVVLKGAYTCITFPDGKSVFNSTGNPGMAKGGSGDALTGMILALISQHYYPENAALLGVYLHGLAGDIAVKRKGVYSMICSDLIEKIPKAFLKLSD